MPKITVFGDSQGLFDAEKSFKAVIKELGQTSDYAVETEIVTESKIKAVNSSQRNVDKVTDVLSFPTLDGIRNTKVNKKDYPFDIDPQTKYLFMGSIIICKKRAKAQAKQYGHSEEREFTYLFVHGLLHLFGYDHMTDSDKAEMREIEDRVMKTLKITRDKV